MAIKKELWWGYLHEQGTLQVKRYAFEEDVREARQSEFCKKVIGKFFARDREEAIEILREKLTPVKRNIITEPLTVSEFRKAGMNMMQYGNPFVKSIGEASLHADKLNKHKLITTFEEYYIDYLKLM